MKKLTAKALSVLLIFALLAGVCPVFAQTAEARTHAVEKISSRLGGEVRELSKLEMPECSVKSVAMPSVGEIEAWASIKDSVSNIKDLAKLIVEKGTRDEDGDYYIELEKTDEDGAYSVVDLYYVAQYKEIDFITYYHMPDDSAIFISSLWLDAEAGVLGDTLIFALLTGNVLGYSIAELPVDYDGEMILDFFDYNPETMIVGQPFGEEDNAFANEFTQLGIYTGNVILGTCSRYTLADLGLGNYMTINGEFAVEIPVPVVGETHNDAVTIDDKIVGVIVWEPFDEVFQPCVAYTAHVETHAYDYYKFWEGFSVVSANEGVLSNFKRGEDGFTTSFDISFGTDCVQQKFTDKLPASHWAHESIDYVLNRGIMSGTSDTTFDPNGTVTRAMVAVMLHNLAGEPAATIRNPFTDVKDSDWFAPSVAWAYENGVVSGNEDGTFNPDGKITREQLAIMMCNFADFKGLYKAADFDLSRFADQSSVSPWAVDAIKWACANGIVSGSDDGSKLYLLPLDTATRMQMAVIFQNFCETFTI